jgi:GNAT superfamily N-acetyltransferase
VTGVVYAEEPGLSVDDYISVLADTTMRTKRPLQNRKRIGEMLAGANLIVTARRDGEIVGLARCITDHAWICYCAELAVRESAQGLGIGAGIIRTLNELLGPRIGLALFSEPEALGFYEKAGLSRLDSGFFRMRADRN